MGSRPADPSQPRRPHRDPPQRPARLALARPLPEHRRYRRLRSARIAFNSYHRGVFLTDLRGPERLVYAGRGRYPHAFFPSGRLLVTGGRALVVLAPDGWVERRYPYLRRRGYGFDARSETLFFVTPRGRLGTLRESGLPWGGRSRSTAGSK